MWPSLHLHTGSLHGKENATHAPDVALTTRRGWRSPRSLSPPWTTWGTKGQILLKYWQTNVTLKSFYCLNISENKKNRCSFLHSFNNNVTSQQRMISRIQKTTHLLDFNWEAISGCWDYDFDFKRNYRWREAPNEAELTLSINYFSTFQESHRCATRNNMKP